MKNKLLLVLGLFCLFSLVSINVNAQINIDNKENIKTIIDIKWNNSDIKDNDSDNGYFRIDNIILKPIIKSNKLIENITLFKERKNITNSIINPYIIYKGIGSKFGFTLNVSNLDSKDKKDLKFCFPISHLKGSISYKRLSYCVCNSKKYNCSLYENKSPEYIQNEIGTCNISYIPILNNIGINNFSIDFDGGKNVSVFYDGENICYENFTGNNINNIIDIDPTAYITNAGFETGDATGWTVDITHNDGECSGEGYSITYPYQDAIWTYEGDYSMKYTGTACNADPGGTDLYKVKFSQNTGTPDSVLQSRFRGYLKRDASGGSGGIFGTINNIDKPAFDGGVTYVDIDWTLMDVESDSSINFGLETYAWKYSGGSATSYSGYDSFYFCDDVGDIHNNPEIINLMPANNSFIPTLNLLQIQFDVYDANNDTMNVSIYWWNDDYGSYTTSYHYNLSNNDSILSNWYQQFNSCITYNYTINITDGVNNVSNTYFFSVPCLSCYKLEDQLGANCNLDGLVNYSNSSHSFTSSYIGYIEELTGSYAYIPIYNTNNYTIDDTGGMGINYGKTYTFFGEWDYSYISNNGNNYTISMYECYLDYDTYKHAITINTIENETNYQLGLNISYSSNMNSDFSDLRFWNEEENVSLDYYLQSKVNSNWAYIWVEIDSIDINNGTQAYMYYGNSSLSSLSNGTATFILFDDFEDADVSDWTLEAGASFSAQNTVVKTGSYSGEFSSSGVHNEAYKSFSATDKIIIDFDIRTNTANDESYFMVEKSGGDFSNSVLTYFNNFDIVYYDTSEHILSTGLSNTWYNIELIIKSSSDIFDVYIDNVLKGSSLDTYGSIISSVSAFSFMRNADAKLYVDNIIGRKYLSFEPIYSFGSITGIGSGSSIGCSVNWSCVNHFCVFDNETNISESGNYSLWITNLSTINDLESFKIEAKYFNNSIFVHNLTCVYYSVNFHTSSGYFIYDSINETYYAYVIADSLSGDTEEAIYHVTCLDTLSVYPTLSINDSFIVQNITENYGTYINWISWQTLIAQFGTGFFRVKYLTDAGTPINSANCIIHMELDTYSGTNIGNGLYDFSIYFDTIANYNFYVTCSKSGYNESNSSIKSLTVYDGGATTTTTSTTITTTTSTTTTTTSTTTTSSTLYVTIPTTSTTLFNISSFPTEFNTAQEGDFFDELDTKMDDINQVIYMFDIIMILIFIASIVKVSI